MKLVASHGLAFALIFSSAACGGGGGGASVQAPQGLSYARSLVLYAKGLEIELNAPTLSGAATSWSVTPALPAGLVLDGATGVLRGTPSELSAARDYAVRASNSAGFAESTLRLGVVRPAFVAVACSAVDNTLSTFVVDARSGELDPTGYAPAPSGATTPAALAVQHQLGVVFVAQTDSNHVSLFELDPSNARLLARENVAVQGVRPEDLALHPSGAALYVFSRQGAHLETFGVHPLDGSLASLGVLSLGANGPKAAAVAADGRFAWVSTGTASSASLTTLAIAPGAWLPTVVGAPLLTTRKVRDLAPTPDGRFLFTLAWGTSGEGVIERYGIDVTTGEPNALDSVTVGAFASSLAVDPTGRFLYVSISSENTLRTFRIDPASGALSAPSDPAAAITPTGDRPAGLAIDASGAHLYVSELNSHSVGVHRIDPATGALERSGTLRTRENPQWLALLEADDAARPRARFAYVGNQGSGDVSVFSAAPATGELTLVESAGLPLGGQPTRLARHPDGAWMYAADTTNGTVSTLRIDPLSGELSALGVPVGAGIQPAAAEVEPSGRFLYVANRGSDNVSSYAIHAQTGLLSQLAQQSVGAGPAALAIDPTGRFLVVANQLASSLSVLEIDVVSGALTPAGAPTVLAGQPTAVAVHPSGSFVLTALGDVGAASLHRLSALDGALDFAQSVACGESPSAIASGKRGWIFVTDRGLAGAGGVTHCRLDPVAETLTVIGAAAAGAHPVDLAVDPSGALLYVVNEGSNDVTRLALDPLSGAPAALSSSPTGVAPSSIELNPTFR